MTDDLTRRRARVARINAKRPPYRVTIIREPEPGVRQDLVDLLFEILDSNVRK